MHARHPLTAAQREDLGDARLVLESAAHNARVACGPLIAADDAAQALANATAQAEQGLATLRRILTGIRNAG